MQNNLKTALQNGETVLGTFQCEISSPVVPEILAHGGLISDLGYPEELASPFDVRLDADSETLFIAYG